MYRVRDYVKNSGGVACSASSTTAVSRVFDVDWHDAQALKVAVKFSAMAEKTGITVALQSSPDGSTWANAKSASAVATVAEIQTLTFPAKASTTGGDYIVLTDYSGQKWAVAVNKSGADAAPTGAVWTAIGAAFKGVANISSDTTAAQVAARFETAFNALTGFTGVFTSDDTAANGTMTMTAVHGGTNLTNPATYSANDGGAGSLAGVQTTAGSFTDLPEVVLNTAGGSDSPLWPKCRVVVITTSGDSCTASNVYVSTNN